MKEEVVQVHFAMPIAKTHETLQKHFRNKPLKTVIDFRCRKEGRKEGMKTGKSKERMKEREFLFPAGSLHRITSLHNKMLQSVLSVYRDQVCAAKSGIDGTFSSQCGWHRTDQKEPVKQPESRAGSWILLDPVIANSRCFCLIIWTHCLLNQTVSLSQLRAYSLSLPSSMLTYTSTLNTVVWTSGNIAPLQSFASCSVGMHMQAHLTSVPESSETFRWCCYL